jgi:biopolymer transport protein ExbD
MAIRHKDNHPPIVSEINITPLTDVMLVLLVIFMVTATCLIAEPVMDVELPSAVSAESTAHGNAEISVVVDRDGRLLVQDQPVSSGQFSQSLLDAARRLDAERKVVVVRGDREAAYGQIIWIMDSARLVGLRHVSLVTEEPD